MAGLYIIIEGPDGTGKTTQAKLLADVFKKEGHNSLYVHEPGQTPMGLELERVIKDASLERSAETNFLLFTANRLEVYRQVIEPALANDEIVVADRNWISSVTYQGVAGEMGIDTIYNETAHWLPKQYLHPSFTVLLYVPEEQHQTMLKTRGTSDKDYFESKPDEFLQKIKTGYDSTSSLLDPKHSARISAGGSIQDVHDRILAALAHAGITPR